MSNGKCSSRGTTIVACALFAFFALAMMLTPIKNQCFAAEARQASWTATVADSAQAPQTQARYRGHYGGSDRIPNGAVIIPENKGAGSSDSPDPLEITVMLLTSLMCLSGVMVLFYAGGSVVGCLLYAPSEILQVFRDFWHSIRRIVFPSSEGLREPRATAVFFALLILLMVSPVTYSIISYPTHSNPEIAMLSIVIADILALLGASAISYMVAMKLLPEDARWSESSPSTGETYYPRENHQSKHR